LALKAPPKEPTRYATKRAGLLFSKEELLQGMVARINEKYAKTLSLLHLRFLYALIDEKHGTVWYTCDMPVRLNSFVLSMVGISLKRS